MTGAHGSGRGEHGWRTWGRRAGCGRRRDGTCGGRRRCQGTRFADSALRVGWRGARANQPGNGRLSKGKRKEIRRERRKEGRKGKRKRKNIFSKKFKFGKFEYRKLARNLN